MNTRNSTAKYIAGTYARFPVVLTHGKGSLVWDEDGKEYIDMGSGIAVNAFGVADGSGFPPSPPSWGGSSTARTSTSPSRTPCSPSSSAPAPA